MDETQSVWVNPYFHEQTPTGKLAYIYMLSRFMADRNYTSLETMAKQTGLSEDVCEQYIAQFQVDRQFPQRIVILEEQLG